MKKLIILVGNVGSGKSTVAKKYIDRGFVCISRDGLRYSIGGGKYIFNPFYESTIWDTELFMLRSFMEKGVNLIVDEVGIDKKMRKRYIKCAKEYDYRVTAIIMPKLSVEESIKQRMNNPRGFHEKIWERVWNEFDAAYEEPEKHEGFDEIIMWEKKE
jgi:predicted kinase